MRKHKSVEDMTGRSFGLLRVTGFSGFNNHNNSVWACVCACGNAIAIVRSSLISGSSQSCGCANRQKAAERMAAANRKHGHAVGGNTSREYVSWVEMRRRCKSHDRAGSKYWANAGVSVCERWSSFENFLTDMGPKPSPLHSLDRYPDQSGDYESGNCRWATAKQQANNRKPPASIRASDDQAERVWAIMEKPR